MVRPRVFVSSTYYDLRHIRKYLEVFLEEMGFDPVLFESGDISFIPSTPLDDSCYREIHNCQMLILIIGGNYGSPSSEIEKKDQSFYDIYNSITKNEFETAKELEIPVFILVDKAVYFEYKTYQKNRDSDKINYAHVDSINIFKLLDEISVHRNIVYLKSFENFEDIELFLRSQFAGLFAELLQKRKREVEIKNLEEQISELKDIAESLRKYSESLMEKIRPERYEEIIRNERLRNEESIKARKFVREPMIDYIRNMIIKPNYSEEKILKAFQKSTELLDFLKYLEIPDDIIKNFIKDNKERALNDYEYLKRHY